MFPMTRPNQTLIHRMKKKFTALPLTIQLLRFWGVWMKIRKSLKWMRKTSIKVRSLLYCRQKWHYHKYDVYSLNPILRTAALTIGVMFLLKYSKYLFFLRQLMIQVDWYPDTWNCTFLFCKNLSNCKSIQSQNIWSNTSMIIL